MGKTIEQEEHKLDELEAEMEHFRLGMDDAQTPTASRVKERLRNVKRVLERKTGESARCYEM